MLTFKVLADGACFYFYNVFRPKIGEDRVMVEKLSFVALILLAGKKTLKVMLAIVAGLLIGISVSFAIASQI